MTSAMLVRAPGDRQEASAVVDGGRLTLGAVIAGVWEGLLSQRIASCPACGGSMVLSSHAGHAALPGQIDPTRRAARCIDCGAALT